MSEQPSRDETREHVEQRDGGTRADESAGTGGESTARERTPSQPAGEQGGPKGPEPTRFGDWEKNGRCFDF
jgi:hypothetical protein